MFEKKKQNFQPRSILLWFLGIGCGKVIPVFPEGPLFPDHDCVRVAGKPRWKENRQCEMKSVTITVKQGALLEKIQEKLKTLGTRLGNIM